MAMYSAAVLILGFAVPAVGAEAGSPPWRRWAIVVTPELRGGGLSDLLTARLSEDASIELVEREQLDLALRELDLATHFGADGAGRRLALGKLLKADALVLLSERRNEDQPFLRLVVSDCVYGARLSEEFRPMKESQPAEAADWALAAIRSTRKRFRAGITHLIAVPPFLSKNLTHEHDHWQAGYAALLGHALSRHQGAAIVEIEEARAIGQELKLVGDDLRRAVVPLFVEAEFTTSTAAADGDPRVRLSVRIKDAKGVRSELNRDELSSEQVVAPLSDELPRRILDLGQNQSLTPIPRQQQQRFLAERAAVFSAVGAFEHATALREAVLLIAPEDVDERIAVVLDYNRWQRARGLENVAVQLASNRTGVFEGKRVDAKTWARTHAERLARFRMTVPHVEHLVRRRQVNPREADEIVSSLVRAMTMNANVNESQLGQQDKQALEEFFWRIYPQFPRLDGALRQGTLRAELRTAGIGADNQSELLQYQRWTSHAINMIVEIFPRRTRVGGGENFNDESRTLGDLHRFLTEIPPRDLPLMSMAELTMVKMNQHIASGRLPIADVRKFYQRLKASDLPFNEFYARCGLLALDVHGGAPAEPLRAEAKSLLGYFGHVKPGDGDRLLVASAYRRHLENLLRAIDQRRGASVQQRPPLPASPLPLSDPRPRLPVSPLPLGDPAPPISFTPTAIAAPWIGASRCNDSLDLLWSFDRVDVMAAGGEVREAFGLDIKQWSFLASDMIYSAHWDGKNIWVATMKSGIFVVSPAGQLLGRVDSETGLPPYNAKQLTTQYRGASGAAFLRNTPLRLHAVEPGKCLAIGQFGGNQRLWFAMIERGEADTFQVDVIHTATKLYDQTERSIADPETVFPLRWTFLHTDPRRSDRRLLLAGRSPGLANVTWPPLAIDLDSRDVSILAPRVPVGFEQCVPQVERNGNLLSLRDGLFPWGSLKVLLPPRDESATAWSGRELAPQSDPRRQGSYFDAFVHQGAIYNPGVHWWRVGGDLLSAEVINDRPLAVEHRFEFYGASAHLGLVAWNRGDQLYRVSFEEWQPADLALRYPFVPAEQRQRHHAAVEAIRRRGGQVGTQWGVAKYPPLRPAQPQWRTIVYLPKEWAGGDNQLALLGDLFNVCELYFVQAAIRNEDLRHVARLENLEELSLVQTNVTDDGVAPLKDHPRLSFCHLESSATEPLLGDAAVAHLSQLPKLVALKLVGRGFTDAALTPLEQRRPLRELLLYDVAITPAAIAALKKLRPSMQVVDRLPN
jgi:hypothetical protein